MTPSFTLGPAWVEQYLSSLLLLNTLLGHPATTPGSPQVTPESIIDRLNEIARGKYKPGQASQSVPGARELILQPPPLLPDQMYFLIVLNASTETSDFASVDSGGIVFEDPAWAVLAAHAIAQSPPLAVPIASDDAGLWHRLGSVQRAIRSGAYSPRDFLGAISGFVAPSSQPEFRLLQVTSQQLTALRARGLQSFGSPLRLYELFHRPPAVR